MARPACKLLWGTANLFSHPRYAAGAATNPDPEVFAFAAPRCATASRPPIGWAARTMCCGAAAKATTRCSTPTWHANSTSSAASSRMVVEHKHKIGFKGTILIEPKPHEPTKHQYDFDTATVYGFLQAYGLEKEVKVNIEANHATLAGPQLRARDRHRARLRHLRLDRHQPRRPAERLGHRPVPQRRAGLTLAHAEMLKGGGFTTGGYNFDAKVRRQSIDPADLFHGHIGGIDMLARALLAAEAIIEDGKLEAFKSERYAGWNSPFGQAVAAKDATLASIADLATQRQIAPKPKSGRQEYLENLINSFC